MHTNWTPDINTPQGPKYKALATAIKNGVDTGELAPSTKLPPIREMAYQLKITPATVVRAYRIGVDQGWLEARIGDGTYVQDRAQPSTITPPQYYKNAFPPEQDAAPFNLRGQGIPEIGQTALANNIIADIANQNGFAIGQYTHPEARRQLQEIVAIWLSKNGINVSGEQIVLTGSATNADIVASRLIGGQSQTPQALVEPACYVGYFDSARLGLTRLVAGEIDADGLTPQSLSHHGNLDLVFTSSLIQTPYSVTMTATRMQEIADAARQADVQIIDDLVHAPLLAPPWQSLRDFAPERVWTSISIAKLGYPSLQFGILIPPPDRVAETEAYISAFNIRPSEIQRLIVQNLLASADFETLNQKLRHEIAERQEITRQILAGFDIQMAVGSPYCWLELPAQWNATAFVSTLATRGVTAASADTFMLEGKTERAIRLTLVGALSRENYARALQITKGLLTNPNEERVI